MKIRYKNIRLERVLIGANILAAAVVTASFVVLFGFERPLLPTWFLYKLQAVLLCVFIAEKLIRILNAVSKAEFWRVFWFEIPLLFALIVGMFGAGRWFAKTDAAAVRHFTMGIYLVVQVMTKVCRTTVNLAASGRSPTRTLIASFLVLIIAGAAMLMLPKSASHENVGFVDALFTATSATCVTGLIVKDTGQDFSLMGQIVILSLIQLGGLGIIVFGAVFALLLRQALTLRESVAMQDLLSAQALGRIGNMIAFIFMGTLFFEAIGAVTMFEMWNDTPEWTGNVHHQWFCSVFHSISAFCNAGFSLFSDNLIGYRKSWPLYLVLCPLIILGGLGFGVLHDLFNIAVDRAGRFCKKLISKDSRFAMESPKRMRLQSKIVLSVSALLIIAGILAILLFENYAAGENPGHNVGFLGALFQSVTARTAGFSTLDVSSMSASSRLVLILLMFIGGSPGSTAGGIKTVTLAVVIITVIATLRKRRDVEIFKRSIRVVVVGRAITVTLLFAVVLLVATLTLSITESGNGFDITDILFESASALGTVGLSAGVTGAGTSLTTAGKLIIILVMLIGRLGPLTLLAALTFNLKPIKYNYPEEAVIVG